MSLDILAHEIQNFETLERHAFNLLQCELPWYQNVSSNMNH